MKNETLWKLTYGMYAIGVKDEAKVSACIVNTVFQVSNTPNTLAVSMNQKNYSHSCIEKEGYFTVSVLSEDTSGAVIGALGFTSGKDTDKLENVRHRVLAEGYPVLQENICCWYLCKVIGKVDVFTHTVFIGEIVAGSDRSVGKPMTYDYYHTVIKGSAPKNAPTYQAPQKEASSVDEAWVCTVCGYEYKDEEIPFEELPDDWTCPICGMPKSAFKRK